MRRGTKIGFALLALLTLTAAGCDERPFTRDYARSVPNSAIQVGELTDRTWEYVDADGVSRELKPCEDLSPWNVAYSCTSPDGKVGLTFNDSNTASTTSFSTSAAKRCPCTASLTQRGATH